VSVSAVVSTGRRNGAWPKLAETADGRLVLLSTADGGAELSRWDPHTGRQVWRFSEFESPGQGWAVARSAGGLIVAAATEEGVQRVDGLTGTALPSPLMENANTVWDVAAGQLPDGRPFFTGAGHFQTVHRWNAMTGRPLGPPLAGHSMPVMSVAVVPAPAGTVMIASGDESGSIRRWNALTGEPIGKPITASNAAIRHILPLPLPLPNGRTLLAGIDSDSVLRRWDAHTGAPLGDPTPLDSEYPRMTAAVIAGTARLFTSDTTAVIREWDATTGKLIGEPLTGTSLDILIRANGSPVFATGSREGDITIYA
jgi:WD40 repeat protein